MSLATVISIKKSEKAPLPNEVIQWMNFKVEIRRKNEKMWIRRGIFPSNVAQKMSYVIKKRVKVKSDISGQPEEKFNVASETKGRIFQDSNEKACTTIENVSQWDIKAVQDHLTSEVIGNKSAITKLIKVLINVKRNKLQIPICFVGPFKVGKTTVVSEIANAMKLKLITVSAEPLNDIAINKLLVS